MAAGRRRLRDRTPALRLETIALLYRARWLLRTRPLDECVARMTPELATERVDERVVRDVERVTRQMLQHMRPLRTTCMVRALVRCAMLRVRGIPATWVMGVRPGADDLEGHAWIEVEGVPIMEDEPPRFTPTFRHPRVA